MSKKRTLLLILTCLGLGALVVLDNWDKVAHRPAAQVEHADASASEEMLVVESDSDAAESAGLQLENPLGSIELAQLENWVERPLFAPSRQRPPLVAPSKQTAATHIISQRPRASYDLLGVLREGERAIALLRRKGEGTSFRVEVGDMIGGWRIARMEATSVLLERGDGTTQTVELLRD